MNSHSAHPALNLLVLGGTGSELLDFLEARFDHASTMGVETVFISAAADARMRRPPLRSYTGVRESREAIGSLHTTMSVRHAHMRQESLRDFQEISDEHPDLLVYVDDIPSFLDGDDPALGHGNVSSLLVQLLEQGHRVGIRFLVDCDVDGWVQVDGFTRVDLGSRDGKSSHERNR